MTETQLSVVTTKHSARSFRSGGQKLQRHVRPHFSHPAPLRQGSQWAGKWTGVSTVSDWPSTTLTLPWPEEHWNTGRVLLTRHWIGQLPVTIGGFYGFAQGPTWPKARQQSDQLLETFTQHVVLGMSGIRILLGDFNHDPGELVQQQIWARHGWCNAQTLAADTLHHEWQPTCKHTTERDQIWLSPEAASLLRGLSVQEHFADHATVQVQLHVPFKHSPIARWPRPAAIEWQKLDCRGWEPMCSVELQHDDDTTEFLKSWAQDFEDKVSEQFLSQNEPPLHQRYRGRAQRIQPVVQEVEPPLCKPSREGEVRLQCSLTGTAVRMWFKQLRRLQSLCHATKANKQTASAVSYRAELWSAILNASGFHPTFSRWWRQRESPCDGAPCEFPETLPGDHAVVQALYFDFLLHFRAFETWHLQQRQASLKMKYEGSLSSIYMDLRDEPKPSIDHIWKERKYQILALDRETKQVMLDQEIGQKFDSMWYHEGSHIQVSQINGAVCTVSNIDNFEVEDEFIQRVFISEVNDVLDTFTQQWSQRWNAFAELSESDWKRVIQFTQAFMPTMPFSLPPLEPDMWYKAVNKFKPKAARGPDGFGKADLQNMPSAHVRALLKMFAQIEQDKVGWPKQLLCGLVIGIAKRRDAHEESHYRPITLFSMLFRCWAKLRTKHMINQLAQYMPAEALGFLPHREAAEVWLLLQGQIEVMLAYDEHYCGLSSDVRRAFNHIGRPQVFKMGQHVGLPSSLLCAWQGFLSNFERRFDVRGCIGKPIKSDSGFPEGDPMSIVAMLMVNWGYHIYMRQFAPKVQAFSFVDNMTMAAREAQHVFQGHAAMTNYHALFGLTMDDDKTYVWALTTSQRKSLQRLGFQCLYDASELGASMSYGAKIRNRHLKARGTGLEEKWKRLQRSLAPFPQKLTMLSKVFWPRALHGSPACVFADNYLTSLRRAATKALKINGAGTNPILRLTLSDDMMNDPGFYQLRHCVSTLRRISRKSPDLLPLWQLWHTQFHGKMLPGPFTKLTTCLNQIGWQITAPPFVRDHDQFEIHLLHVDEKTLHTRLKDAWCQFAAATTNHKTMKDLHGLDLTLTMWRAEKLQPVERALLSALHSGAFISESEHSKFDQEKSAQCDLCNCVNDRAHWLVCPRFSSLRQTITDWQPDNVELPTCVKYHLLVPRLQSMTQWRGQFVEIKDQTFVSSFYTSNTGLHHLFTDGACTQHSHQCLNYAAWGVISASDGDLIAIGHLTGITQTIDRAELTAILAAVRWSTDADICIWSDSLSCVKLAEFVLLHGYVPATVENYDLWLGVLDALTLRQASTTMFRWVPSHIHADEAEDVFESWAIHWNNVIDSIVTAWNHHRSAEFWHAYETLNRQLHWWTMRIQQLRTFYFKVTEFQQQETSKSPDQTIVIDSDDEHPTAPELLADQLPVNWAVRSRQTEGKVPGTFVTSILQWFCAAEQLDHHSLLVSDLEVVFLFLLDGSFQFPFRIDGSLQWSMKCIDDLFQKPTLVMLLRPVQLALQQIEQLFPELIFRTPPRSWPDLGVYIKLRGLKTCLPLQLVQQARARLTLFTQSRPVKRTGDLSRPWT